MLTFAINFQDHLILQKKPAFQFFFLVSCLSMKIVRIQCHDIMTLNTFYDALICTSGLVAWIGQISHRLTYSYFPYDVKLNGIFHLWKRFRVKMCLPINLNWFLVPCYNDPYFQIDFSHNMSSDLIENVSMGVYQFWFDKIFSMSIMDQGE